MPQKAGSLKGAAAELLGTPTDPAAAAAFSMELHERFVTRTFDAAVAIAIHDERFRKRLAAKLKGLAEGRPRRVPSTDELCAVVSMAELLTLNLPPMSRTRLFDEVSQRLGIPATQARDRYYRARRIGLNDKLFG